jgi:acyl-CoA synthetase
VPRGAQGMIHSAIEARTGSALQVGTVADHARVQAIERPAAVALHFQGAPSATFGEIWAEGLAVAAALQSLGLLPGDVLSFQLPNWRETVVINLAAASLGLIVNPIIPIYRGAELAFILRDCRSKAIFIPHHYRSFDFEAMLKALRPELPDLRHVLTVRSGSLTESTYENMLRHRQRPVPTQVEGRFDARARKLILYTSGTTGRAKGVVHSHGSIFAATTAPATQWPLGDADVMLMPSPVTHIAGYTMGLELPFYTGVKSALVDRWDPASVIRFVDEVGASASVGATPFLRELLDEAQKQGNALASMRLFACGGASIPADLIYRTRKLNPACRAFRIYGATEVPFITTAFRADAPERLSAETDGRLSDYEVKIVDSENRQVPPGREGEILVRGRAMMLGYTDARDTGSAFDSHGYFKTGDIGRITPEHAIVVTGRIKDLIIRGGENLSAKEIEDALQRHPAITEAAVVSMPHPRLGEGVCAFLRMRAPEQQLSIAEIGRFLDEIGLARQKCPERVEYVSDFSRTASGKIRKDVLRRLVHAPSRQQRREAE